MSEIHSTVAENFSLTRGGPLYWLQVRFGRAQNERTRVVRRTLFAIAGTFLRDFAVNARVLIALPILILSESNIDRQWRILVVHFLRAGLVSDAELPSFEAVVQGITRLRDRVLPEAIMLVVAYGTFLVSSHTELLMGNVSNWHYLGSGSNQALSLAEWWFIAISTPFFRFLGLRWMWRMALWTLFLWRSSKINLCLVATHTDMAAGLGFLSAGQKRFSPIVFAGGAVIASQVGNAIAYEGATLGGMKLAIISYGVLATLFLVAPLLVTTPLLMKTKRRALLDYGALVTSHNQSFATKWIGQHAAQGNELLGDPDASSLIDLGSSFQVVQEMKPVPINKSTLLTLVGAAALPMVPLVVLVTPADELVRAVVKMLV